MRNVVTCKQSAIDEDKSKEISYVPYEKTMRFPPKILIKCNVLIELYEINYNIEDEFINGAYGTCIIYTKNKNNVDVIWIVL